MLLNEFLLLGAALFAIGVYGVLARRNGVMVLMSIELILNAVNINLVAFGALHHTVVGQVFALFVITIAAAEVGVGLAIVLHPLPQPTHRSTSTSVDAMKGDAVILHWVWLMPAIMAASFVADPVLRQAHAEEGRGDRHRRRRALLRPRAAVAPARGSPA